MNEPEKPLESEAPTDEILVTTPARRRIHPAVIAVGGIAAVLLVLLVGWLFLGSSGDAGRPVPAPRMPIGDATPADTILNKTLTLSAEQVENAGITQETVGEQLSTESFETSATGTVEANAYRQTPAVTIAGGIVRRVIPVLGDSVRAGQTVAVIYSDEFAQTQSRYIALVTAAENARRNYQRTQSLVAINQPGRSELEQATKQRRAAEAALSEMRNRFERTTRLITIGAASREELDQDTTRLRTAEAEVEEARQRERRAQQLLPISPEVRAASEEALNSLQTAEADLASTRQRLILFGMSSSQVNSLRSASQIAAEINVPAPASGVVTARSVNPGEVVEANKVLLQVTDLSSVWVIAQVYEADLGRMRVGSGGSITSDAFPNELFRGTITYIDPQIDAATRTAKVRLEVANSGQRLKLGMYVRVAFGALGQAERTVPVIATSAVQSIGGQQIVFLPTADPNVFELRPVRLGEEINGKRPVFEGLTVGDKVVTNGSFTLRAEWLKINQGSQF